MSTFTWAHTALSVAALIAGLIVVIGLFSSKTLGGWTAIFLATAIATSATGFGFPFQSFGASHWIGVISLAVLVLAVLARYVLHYAGAWRWLYAVCTVVAFSEPPFVIAQVVAMVIFVVIAVATARKFRPGARKFSAPA
jgi:hypothetical protein